MTETSSPELTADRLASNIRQGTPLSSAVVDTLVQAWTNSVQDRAETPAEAAARLLGIDTSEVLFAPIRVYVPSYLVGIASSRAMTVMEDKHAEHEGLQSVIDLPDGTREIAMEEGSIFLCYPGLDDRRYVVQVNVDMDEDYCGLTLWYRKGDDLDHRATLESALADLVEPDPFLGKTISVTEGGVKVVKIESQEHLSSYSEDVEDAVSAVMGLADPGVRVALDAARIPPRASILLEGPPGSGKSTLVRRVVSQTSEEVTCILASPGADLEDVFEMAHRYPISVVVLEDVESFSGHRGEGTFSTFLNLLDGVDHGKGAMVVLATTNDSSALDPAVLRPGRIDRSVCIGAVRDEAISQIISSHLAGREDAESIACGIRAGVAREECVVTAAIVSYGVKEVILRGLHGEDAEAFLSKDWTPKIAHTTNHLEDDEEDW